jgi:gamma-glutamylcyclotransferase (GGCT)/AIG2-like uncharacterized protein YtfP
MGETAGVLPVFVYGTLRAGSWNHRRWLAPWLRAPCRPGRLDGYCLHHLDGLPYVVAGPGHVVGDVADLDGARHHLAVAALDTLEDVDGGQYRRVTVALRSGEQAWTYVAGPRVADRLGAATAIGHGDWLATG